MLSQTSFFFLADSINSENKPDILMYVYLAAGILAFVIIVIVISVASLHGCKGEYLVKHALKDVVLFLKTVTYFTKMS